MQYKPIHLLWPLGAMSLGIYTQKAFKLPLILLITIATLSIIALIIALSLKNKQAIALSCLQLFFFLGASTLAFQVSVYKKRQKHIPTKKTNITAHVISKTESPQSFYKESLILSPTTMPTKILCYQKNKTNITPGDIITLKNVYINKPKEKSTITGNPPYSHYLIKSGIHATVFLRYSKHKIIDSQSSLFSSIKRWLFIKRKNLFKSLKKKIPEKTFSYFASIFLGNKQYKETNKKNYFYYWGIAHHLARSGLHIALFVIVWATLFSFIPLPYLIKHTLLILLCATYMAFSWASLSFIRALFAFTLYEAGQIFGRQTSALHLLSIITFTVLLLNPMQLFFLDFQLSFGLTMALLAFFERQKAQSIARKRSRSLN